VTQATRSHNGRTAIVLVAVIFGMVGLTAASVPLYRLFCQVTGYGGTTQTAATAPAQVLEREIRVRFSADTNSALPWTFRPAQDQMRLRVGETGLAYFTARNDADRPVTGTATFNVTPAKAGLYFTKIDCFCFTEQRLGPGEEAQMPVTFFVDPGIADDPNLDDVTTITLSYIFFPASSGDEREPEAQASREAAAAAVN
jgi:cytochrome c oxidase assembly protein subunit 11